MMESCWLITWLELDIKMWKEIIWRMKLEDVLKLIWDNKLEETILPLGIYFWERFAKVV